MNKVLENAIVSIRIGVDDYFSADPNRIFSCVRNLFSGVILLFKSKLLDLCPPDSNEVLIRKHILPQIIDGKLVFVGDGNTTIDIYEMEMRFKALNIKTNWTTVKKIQRERNYIEHYFPFSNTNILKGLIVDTFNIVNDFIKQELDNEPKELLKDTWKKMLNIKEIFLKEKNECNEQIDILFAIDDHQKKIVRNIYCNKCGSELLKPEEKVKSIDKAVLLCTNCSNEIKVMDVFEKIVNELYNDDGFYRARNGFTQRINTCPSCYKTCYNEDEDICYYCSYEKEYLECLRCGVELSTEEQDCEGLCFYCYDQFQKLSDDD